MLDQQGEWACKRVRSSSPGTSWNISSCLLLLCVLTLGLALPYYAYWNFKYFFSNMEVELYQPGNPIERSR